MKIVSLRPTQWVPNQLVNIKPHLRGWLHLVSAPLSLAASIVLTVLAPTTGTRWASVVYLVTSLLLFAISATYHRLYWSPAWEKFWRRLDHSNIFLLIAGTYTPLCVALLPFEDARFILTLVWSVAGAGVVFSMFWPGAPRWLITLMYVGLGWVAIWYIPQLWEAGGPVSILLIAIGGILYTIGAVVYALKKPNPWPKWFGFHEVFHSFTVLAWACQCVAVYFAVLGTSVH